MFYFVNSEAWMSSRVNKLIPDRQPATRAKYTHQRNSKILIHSSCCWTSVVSINSFGCKKTNKQDARTICHGMAKVDKFGKYALATNKEWRSHHLSFWCPLCLLLFEEFGYLANQLKARQRQAVASRKRRKNWSRMGAAKAKEISREISRDCSFTSPLDQDYKPSTPTYFTEPYFANLKKESAIWHVIIFIGCKESTLKAIQ